MSVECVHYISIGHHGYTPPHITVLLPGVAKKRSLTFILQHFYYRSLPDFTHSRIELKFVARQVDIYFFREVMDIFVTKAQDLKHNMHK